MRTSTRKELNKIVATVGEANLKTILGENPWEFFERVVDEASKNFEEVLDSRLQDRFVDKEFYDLKREYVADFPSKAVQEVYSIAQDFEISSCKAKVLSGIYGYWPLVVAYEEDDELKIFYRNFKIGRQRLE